MNCYIDILHEEKSFKLDNKKLPLHFYEKRVGSFILVAIIDAMKQGFYFDVLFNEYFNIMIIIIMSLYVNFARFFAIFADW